MPESAAETLDRAIEFAAQLGWGVANLEPDDLRHDAMVLKWGLSAWMRRSNVGIDEAWQGVGLLRSALLLASGLDRSSEPTPLRASDPAAALVNVVMYLDCLVERAGAFTQKARHVVLDEALALLGG